MTQEILHIALFQSDLVWENPKANRDVMDQWFQQVSLLTDIVFLPEMFTTGFSMNVAQLAETMEGETVQWMKKHCKEKQFALCGSLIIQEKEKYYNRLVFVEPSGEVHFYNKRHLFTMGGEESHFQQGTERLIVQYKGWRICPLICYDIRFPVWSRNCDEYDLLVYVANWPRNRDEVWNTLLKSRAIENQSYVAGVNRVGVDGQKIQYSGYSQVINAKGKSVATTNGGMEGMVEAEMSYSELEKFKITFPVLKDADYFKVLKVPKVN
ncbi:MAG TPA: amidohydrolase [Prolixibacteraceae bacterium]|jgi:predicted amidohydrolase|nr:amidohydrolase [Prolixibacteraceae bacterium]